MKEIKNITEKVKNLWIKYIKEPIFRTYKKNKEKRELDRKIANIRKDFEKRFDIKINDVKRLMYPKGVVPTNNPFERQVFLNQELEKAKKLLSNPKNVNRHVFFYEPEIVEIHNESTYLLTKDLAEIKKIDYEDSKAELRKKERELASKAHIMRTIPKIVTKSTFTTNPISGEIYDEDYGKNFKLPFKKEYFF